MATREICNSLLLSGREEAAVNQLLRDHARLVERNGKLRIALADAIRRPLGVVPDSAQGLLDARPQTADATIYEREGG